MKGKIKKRYICLILFVIACVIHYSSSPSEDEIRFNDMAIALMKQDYISADLNVVEEIEMGQFAMSEKLEINGELNFIKKNPSALSFQGNITSSVNEENNSDKMQFYIVKEDDSYVHYMNMADFWKKNEIGEDAVIFEYIQDNSFYTSLGDLYSDVEFINITEVDGIPVYLYEGKVFDDSIFKIWIKQKDNTLAKVEYNISKEDAVSIIEKSMYQKGLNDLGMTTNGLTFSIVFKEGEKEEIKVPNEGKTEVKENLMSLQ